MQTARLRKSIGLGIVVLSCSVVFGVSAASADDVSFTKDIQPLFTANCSPCHITASTAGLSLASYASIMKGGKDGVVIKPGDPDNSLLIQKVKGTATIGARMPFGRTPLTDDKIKLLSDWVAQGAKDDSAGTAQAAATPTAAAATPAAIAVAPAAGEGGGTSSQTGWLLAGLVAAVAGLGVGATGLLKRR
jgi:hypothetical protein